jgi:phosphoenolpyruvate-protein phosphotransferase
MAKTSFSCTVLAPGVAVGTLCVPEYPREEAGAGEDVEHDMETESRRFSDHVGALVERIETDIQRVEREGGTSEAEILRAHATILQEDEFHDRVHSAIQEMELAAEDAVEHVLEEMAGIMAQSEEEVFRERAADFRDLAFRLREHLAAESSAFARELVSVDGPVVVVAELFPSMVLRGHRQDARAFVTAGGTSFAHAVILARSFGIPVVRLESMGPLEEHAGEEVLVDARQGRILLAPTVEEKVAVAPEVRPAPARMGGLPVRLWVNLAEPGQLRDFDWEGIEGIGLYRTEALFMSNTRGFPDEEEQFRAYADLFRHCGERPVTVRTVDIGGDKPLEHMTMGPQENPQLGLRAHRLYRYHPEILITQMRAILRAALPGTRLRILYPLIETEDQWRFVQQLTDSAVESLEKEGREFCREFQVGPLIETPIAAWRFDRLAGRADFVSVGTNDLVQYLFAVDRNNANVGFMYQPEHPAVLQVLRELQHKADALGCRLTICGEIAGDPRLLPLLVGLGLEDLSVNLPALPGVLEAVAALDQDRCAELAQACLEAEGVEEVRERLDRWHGTERRDEMVEGEAMDPVCGMAVDSETPFMLEVGGVRHYFCSRHCLEAFRKDH